jgi:transglutaminase-like putative cysteine protease
MDSERSSRSRTLPLVLVLALADAALALAYRNPVTWTLVLVAAAPLVVQLRRLPRRLATRLTWVSWLLLAVVAVRGETLGWPLGVVLAVFAGFFLMSEEFAVHRAFMPATLGVFLASASTTRPPYFEPIAWLATGALALWLTTALSRVRWQAVVLFAVPVVAVGEGLIVLLPWAQPKVEQAAADFMDPTVAATGLSIGGRLGDIERLALSRRVILRMWAQQPADLRASVYTQFDGRMWRLPRVPSAVRPATSRAPSAATAMFIIEEHSPGFLPAPSNVDGVDAGSEPMAIDRFGLVHSPLQPPERYAVHYTPGPVPRLERDEDIVAECLRMPEHVDPRVRELAAQLGPGSATPKQKIARTLAHMQTRCRYSLDVGSFTSADPVAEFLFEKKKGYCEYFASATVILLRLQGVPARYVNGLSVRDADRRGDHFVVRASDAHAWAEALDPGAGWVEVDSTPAGDYAAVHNLPHNPLEDAMEAIAAWWNRVSLPGLLVAVLTAMVIAGLGAMIVRKIRNWRPRPRVAATTPIPLNVSPELMACFRSVESLWARAGCPRPPYRGPLEHAASLPADRVSADLREAGAAVVDRLYRAAYGREEIGPEEVTRLTQALERVRRPAAS